MNSWPYNFFKSYTSWNLALRYFRLTPTPEAVSNPSQMGRLTAHIFRVQASARSCTLEPVLASRREQGPTSHHVKVAPHTAWQGRQNSNYFTASNSFNSWIWCIFGAALYARCVTAWKRRDTTHQSKRCSLIGRTRFFIKICRHLSLLPRLHFYASDTVTMDLLKGGRGEEERKSGFEVKYSYRAHFF